MTDANKQLVRRWFDQVWNQGNVGAIDELFSPNGIAHDLINPGDILRGPAEFKRVHASLLGAFSKIQIHLDELVAEGDNVAVRWTATGKHTGAALGFPATGHDVRFSGSSFVCIEDGQILEAWNHMDFTHVVQELQSASPS
jgi:steroid delta-isomerase-like uncharacterized protein